MGATDKVEATRHNAIVFAMRRIDELSEIVSDIRHDIIEADEGFRKIAELAFAQDYSSDNLGHVIWLHILVPSQFKQH